jgi:predicted nucleic acid-binding Zn ribbon protein
MEGKIDDSVRFCPFCGGKQDNSTSSNLYVAEVEKKTAKRHKAIETLIWLVFTFLVIIGIVL